MNGKLYDTIPGVTHNIFVTSQYFPTVQCLSQRDLNSGPPQFEAGVLSITPLLLSYVYGRLFVIIIFMHVTNKIGGLIQRLPIRRFQSYGVWHSAGQIVLGVSKDGSAFVFMARQLKSWNIGKHSPNDTALLELSETPLRAPQMRIV